MVTACTGTVDWLVALSPSWPCESVPQHHTLRSALRIAQAWLTPIETDAYAVPGDTACVGPIRKEVSPTPSWPTLLSPQQ